MTKFEEEVTPLRHAAEAEVVRRYEAHRGLLLRLLTRNFHVPPAEAELMVYETFMACETVGGVPDVEAWLIAGASEKGKAYQRAHGGAQALAAAADVELLRDALALLPRPVREALRLRFEEGLSYPEIAAELGISAGAAERIVAKAAAKIRKMQRLRGK